MTTKEFQHTVAPIKDKLYRFALRMMDNIPEAQDVVQEVLVKLWTQRERLTQITNVEAWSIRMTRNASIDKIRTRPARTEEINAVLQVATPTATPAEETEQNDTMEFIAKIINRLPEKQRLVMHLRDIEGYTYQEIADSLTITMNDVKVNLFRARKAVRVQLVQTELIQKPNR